MNNILDKKYYQKIRRAIVDQGAINIQQLASRFNILPGNTYFRNFINGKGENNLGSTGLKKILNKCGYSYKVVVFKESDTQTLNELNKIMDESFINITSIISRISTESKKTEVVKKKKKEPAANKNLISNALFKFDNIDDDFDEELAIG